MHRCTNYTYLNLAARPKSKAKGNNAHSKWGFACFFGYGVTVKFTIAIIGATHANHFGLTLWCNVKCLPSVQFSSCQIKLRQLFEINKLQVQCTKKYQCNFCLFCCHIKPAITYTLSQPNHLRYQITHIFACPIYQSDPGKPFVDLTLLALRPNFLAGFA